MSRLVDLCGLKNCKKGIKEHTIKSLLEKERLREIFENIKLIKLIAPYQYNDYIF
jgi:predicted regulator of amino acid metabolism with ACT domain